MSTDELIFCPGGCGRQLHRRANACPNCGYRTETTNFDELLTGISTASAVVVGFVLAALVIIACSEANVMKAILFAFATGCWIFASLLLLFVVIFAASLRNRDITFGTELPDQLENAFRSRCDRLLSVFTTSLVIIAIGLILMAFAFSNILGIVAVIGATIACFLIGIILT
jgi:hypothetical protein